MLLSFSLLYGRKAVGELQSQELNFLRQYLLNNH